MLSDKILETLIQNNKKEFHTYDEALEQAGNLK